MPLRMEFFDEPMLRATPIRYLNDPFEADVQKHQLIDVLNFRNDEGELGGLNLNDEDDESTISESYEEHDKWFNENKHSLADAEQKRLISDFKQFGIVSFTEDYSNLLMWSHYADEHTGMVIEFSNEVTWLKTINSHIQTLYVVLTQCLYRIYVSALKELYTEQSDRNLNLHPMLSTT